MTTDQAAAPRTLLAVDGNSLTHRAYHAFAESGLKDGHGRPAWAVRGFWNLFLATVDRIGPDAVVVGFDDPTSSRRRSRFPTYKAHRKPKDADLVSQLALIPQTLATAGVTVMTPDGLEADDVMAAAARHAACTPGWHCVIATSDRDAFAQIGEHTSVLRLINGGLGNAPLLNPSRFSIMTGIRPEQYLDYAAMRGDASDNLGGVRGIGEKTAAALLAAFPTMADVWADLDHNDGAGVVAAAGRAAVTKLRAEGAREAWETNRLIMTPSTSLTLPHHDPNRALGELPLSDDHLTRAFIEAGLPDLINAARSRLCLNTDIWKPARSNAITQACPSDAPGGLGGLGGGDVEPGPLRPETASGEQVPSWREDALF